MTISLLGPQRFHPTVADAVRAAAPDGPVATVTAGWREREAVDAELDALLDGRSANLRLYLRRLEVFERDPDLASAHRARREVLDELAGVYLARLQLTVEAYNEVRRRGGRAQVVGPALADALEAVRALDAHHLARVDEVNAEFSQAWRLPERPAVADHRAAVAGVVGGAAAVAVAGGHVDSLLDCLELFRVQDGLHGQPVLAWSAGAMALTERVVLFHDHAPHSPGYAEVYGRGLGLSRGVVALPHARRRLRLDDRRRMALLARRFAPARCVVLDDGGLVDCGDGDACPLGTRVVADDGTVATLEPPSAGS